MKIFKRYGFCVLLFLMLLNGVEAQLERKPIPEVDEAPLKPETVDVDLPKEAGVEKKAAELEVKKPSDLEVKKPEGIEVKKPKQLKLEDEITNDGPIDIEDTLFAPAKPGAEGSLNSLPSAPPNEPVDASTIAVAATAPKDDQMELMQVYEGLRQFDNGIAAADLILKRDPNNWEALAAKSRMLTETGRTSEAIDYANRLIKVRPTQKSQSVKAAALIGDSQVEAAETLLLEMKSKHKGSRPFQYETLLGFAKLDRGRKAEARAIFEGIVDGEGYDAFELDAAKKQLLLMDLDRALQWRDEEAVQASIATLRREYQGEPETKAAEAVERFLAGDADAAASQIAVLRSDFPRLRLFPFLLQLADFSYEAGDFKTAEAAYAESLADRRTRPLDRESAIRNRAQLRIREGQQISIDQAIVNGDEGSLSTTTLKARKAVGDDWFLGAEVTRQGTDLDGDTAVRSSDDRIDGVVVIERRLKKGRFAEARIGGSEEGVTGGVTVGKRARIYADAWSIGVSANERANDSAQLASLNGRQHRVSATYQREINPRMVLSAEAIVRQVEVDGSRLGNGAGIEGDFSYRLNEEERNSNFFLAWRSAYAKFNRSGYNPSGSEFDQTVVADLGTAEVVDGLVEPEFSRHGVEIRHEGQWREVLFTRAMAGLFYRSDSSDVELTAGVGADWFFTDEMRLYFDALYTSSGRASNTGEGVIEAKVGVARSF